MSIVRTKEEFKKALEAKERRIMVIGELAASMRVKAKVKKASIIGGIALIAGGVIAAPFTGGTSLTGTFAGATMVAEGAALTLTVSAAELAILCGCTLGLYGIYKKCKISFGSDGSVTVEPTYN